MAVVRGGADAHGLAALNVANRAKRPAKNGPVSAGSLREVV
jgi:hypothetical protein